MGLSVRGFAALAVTLASAQAQTQAIGSESPRQFLNDFDIRRGRPARPATSARSGGTTPLTAPAPGKAELIAREYLRSHRLLAADPDASTLAGVTQSLSGGAWAVTFRQHVRGVPVFGAAVDVILDAKGRIWSVDARDLVFDGSVLTTVPRIGADEAIESAFRAVGRTPLPLGPVSGSGGRAVYVNPLGSRFSDITADLVVFPAPPAATLAWRISLDCGGVNWYEVLIDAATGSLLRRQSLSVDATARVWTESPLKGPREIVAVPAEWLADPGQTTTGNNVDAYLDTNGDGKPDANAGPDVSDGRAYSPAQEFDFPAGEGFAGLDPRGSKAAAVTNIFYFVNRAHDWFYSLGFTESSWNFQADNFGRGGLGGDAIRAEAQSSASVNNAAFLLTPDGVAPRLLAGIFTMGTSLTTDDRDAAYDGTVLFHEMAHGLTDRLVGRGQDVACLAGLQSRALAEGWSDYFAASFFNNPVAGGYVSGNALRGLRRASLEANSLGYADLGNSGYDSHRDGEVWAAVLWDLRKALGASVADRLLVDALKITPCHPGMIQARDAILTADQASANGANRGKIWEVFARRGMGHSACGNDGSDSAGTIHNAAFDLPPDLAAGPRPPSVACPADGNLAPASLGRTFRYEIKTASDSGPLQFQLATSATGMVLESGGVLTWMPSFAGQRAQITITNSAGQKAIHTLFIPVDTPVALGQSVMISALQGESGFAHVEVPPGASAFQVTLRDGTGDADLGIFDPDGILAGGSAHSGPEETVTMVQPKAGAWRLQVHGTRNFANVSLRAEVPEPVYLGPTDTVAGLSGRYTSETFYRLPLVPGAPTRISTSGGSGDVDLYARIGRWPACGQIASGRAIPCVADKSSAHDGNAESIEVASSQGQDAYLLVRGYRAYSGVTLTTATAGAPTLVVNPTAIRFAAAEGAPAPAPATVFVTDASGKPVTFSFAVEAAAADWLRAALSGAALTVSVATAGLAPASYTGRISISAAGLAGSPQTITVTLGIAPRATLSVSPGRLLFSANQGQPLATQNLALTTSEDWVATAQTSSGGNWLIVQPPRGSGSATLRISISPSGLAAGSYGGAISISTASGSRLTVPVDLTLAAVAAISRILNAATLTTRPIAPQQRLVIYGSNLADPCGETCPSVQASPFPSMLGNTSVTFNGSFAAMLYASPEQINLMTPPGVTGSTATVTVLRRTPGGALFGSLPVEVPVAPQSLGIFTVLGNGAGAGLIRHADGALVSRDRPLAAGETITILVTGLGVGTAAPSVRLAFDGLAGRVLANRNTADPGVGEVRAIVPATLPRSFPVVTLESDISAADPVSAGGPSLLDVTPDNVRPEGEVTIQLRGANFPSPCIVRVGDTALDAEAIATADGVRLRVVIPADLLVPGILSLRVEDPAAPAEEPSNAITLRVAN